MVIDRGCGTSSPLFPCAFPISWIVQNDLILIRLSTESLVYFHHDSTFYRLFHLSVTRFFGFLDLIFRRLIYLKKYWDVFCSLFLVTIHIYEYFHLISLISWLSLSVCLVCNCSSLYNNFFWKKGSSAIAMWKIPYGDRSISIMITVTVFIWSPP